MRHLPIIALAVCGMMATVQAAPPGPLDGQSIPTDYAGAKRIGVQTNSTGVGDVTSLQSVPVFTQGSELNGIYLAKDTTFLYVGLTGNLLALGSPFVILIDNPFESGQNELRTEGVGGPAFMLQLAGRQVVVNDNGTPGNPADDTYTVVPNSGTMLPTCGDPGFTGWDYALAVDVSDNNTMYAHEYILFGFPIGTANPAELCHFGDSRGRVSCDPTPDNPNDPQIPIYAIRNLVASSPVGDGNEVFEGGQPAFGYQRGGFNNSNVSGVTDTGTANAGAATKGLEIAIPLANIGGSPLFGNETIHILVLTMDGDEYQQSSVTHGYGTFVNQALPSLTGPSCNPPASLGMRPNLSTVATCLTVNLATLSFIDTGAVLDGNIVANDYDSHAPKATQHCPTSGGDQVQLPNQQVPGQNGSELDAMYVSNDNQNIYLGMTGNLQAGGNSINLFVDTNGRAGGGDALLSEFSTFAFTGTYNQWTTATITPGPTSVRIQSTDYGGGFFDLNPNISAPGATELRVNVTVNAANQANRFRIILADEDTTERAYQFDVPPGPGTYSLSVPISNYVSEGNPGTIPGLDLSRISFFHVTGGFNNGNPGVTFDMTFDRLALADSDEGDHVLNFDPGPSGFNTTLITNFNNFHLTGTYVSWNTATLTSGPTSFRVQATGGFGGGFYDINPNLDLTGSTSLELAVTLNPGSSSGGVLLVLADDDGTEKRWSWFGLSPGTYLLTAPLSAGTIVTPGGIAGFNPATVSFFHLQGDFSPNTDITFDNLAARGALPGVAPVLTMNGDELANGPLDVLHNGLLIPNLAIGYEFAYGINLKYSPARAYINYFDLRNDLFAFRGAVGLDSGNSVLFDEPGGLVQQNPNGLKMAFNNSNILGVTGCASQGLPCFSDSAAAVSALALQATTGVEMSIPLADLGLTSADLPRIIHLWAESGEQLGFASNQSLPSMRNSSYEGNQVVNPGDAPVKFTSPESGPNAGAVLSSFSSFVPSGTYAAWTTATFTSGATTFRVQSTDFGGCYFTLSPSANATGATTLVVDVTLNPANQTDRLNVILFDGDGTVREFVFLGLTNGVKHLTVDMRNYTNQNSPGSVPGLDLSNLVQFNIAGAFHNNPPRTLDMTFDNLQLVGGVRNFEARAARVCLSTVPGDGDCDGDNDLIDVALFQQCFGSTASPVFPMECEQLDLVKNHVINSQDFASLEPLITGPVGP